MNKIRNVLDRFFIGATLYIVKQTWSRLDEKGLRMFGLTSNDMEATCRTLNTFLKSIEPKPAKTGVSEQRVREIVREELIKEIIE